MWTRFLSLTCAHHFQEHTFTKPSKSPNHARMAGGFQCKRHWNRNRFWCTSQHADSRRSPGLIWPHFSAACPGFRRLTVWLPSERSRSTRPTPTLPEALFARVAIGGDICSCWIVAGGTVLGRDKDPDEDEACLWNTSAALGGHTDGDWGVEYVRDAGLCADMGRRIGMRWLVRSTSFADTLSKGTNCVCSDHVGVCVCQTNMREKYGWT
jgi:hypothetical protein